MTKVFQAMRQHKPSDIRYQLSIVLLLALSIATIVILSRRGDDESVKNALVADLDEYGGAASTRSGNAHLEVENLYDGWAPAVQGINDIDMIEFNGLSADAAERIMQHLLLLPNLRKLIITNSDMDHKSQSLFGQLKSITDLDLSRIKLDDDGYRAIGSMRSLKSLRLSDTDLTEVRLRELAKSRSILHLDVEFGHVTDNGLKALSEMRQLQYVRVPNAYVTDAGLQAFHAALPKCNITP